MRRFDSKYPISTLLASSLKTSDIHSLATAIGYKKKAKMFRRLDEWLLTGKGKSALLTKLINVGSLQEPQVTASLNETSLILDAEKKALSLKTFKPHIYIETERPITSFCIGLLASRVKYIYDKGLSSAVNSEEALKVARRVCKNHFLQSRGRCEYFGKITGYKVYWKMESSFSLSAFDCLDN